MYESSTISTPAGSAIWTNRIFTDAEKIYADIKEKQILDESESSYPNSNEIIELGEDISLLKSDRRDSSSSYSEGIRKCMVDMSTQTRIDMVTIPLEEITINVETEQGQECDSSDTELYYQETSFIETRSGSRYNKF